MKTRITILAILFVLFDIFSLNALDKQERTEPQQHNPFPEMNQQKEQYPPGFKDMNQGGAVKLMKKANAIQSNADFLVESVKVYSTVDGESKNIYTYNDNKQILTYTVNIWQNEEWVIAMRYSHTYDENGNILTELEGNYSRRTYTYDENGNLIELSEEIWGNEEWVIFGRRTYTYDENGNQHTLLREIRQNNELINTWKYTFIYDKDVNLLTELDEEKWVSQGWVNYGRYTYTYDENDSLLTDLFERWYGGWVNDGKYTYTYDENGNRLTWLYEEWLNEEWEYSWRFTYIYGEAGNLLTWLYEEWQNEEWVIAMRYTYTYDEAGNLIKTIKEKWRNEEWVEKDGYLSFEDSNGNIFRWERIYKAEITWRNATSVKNESEDRFSVASFPNPFNQLTTINYELRMPANVTLNIYDVLGNKITTLVNEYQDIGSHQAIFDAIKTGNRLPQGMYYYTIQINQQIERGKLLLIR